ncbi:hypothetical protein K3495_g3876 [Podosphaera aphanis]|nr:hypothetical protein K3495_g3876 [Podosphaera aphanis]
MSTYQNLMSDDESDAGLPELRQELDGLRQQIAALQQAQTPLPHTQNITIIKDPAAPNGVQFRPTPLPEYDGNKSNYPGWRQAVLDIFRMYWHNFGYTDTRAFLLIYTALKGDARSKAGPFYETGGVGGTKRPEDFIAFLNRGNLDNARSDRASDQLYSLRMNETQRWSSFFLSWAAKLTEACCAQPRSGMMEPGWHGQVTSKGGVAHKPTKTMTQIEVKSILGSGVSFPKWRSALQAKLGRRNVLGHVFHNVRGIRPRPEPATPETQSEEALSKHQADLEEWTLGEIEAKNIIIDRIVPTMCPNQYDNMTAKELYDTIADTRQETAAAPYTLSLDTLLDIKMTTTADAYIDQFQSALQNVNNLADTLSTTDGAKFHIRKGLAAVTEISAGRSAQPNIALAAREPPSNIALNLNDKCLKCRHNHLNRDCFRLHPELATGPKGERWRANRELAHRRGRGNHVAETGGRARAETDNDDSDGIVVAARTRRVAICKIGDITFKLENALYSPNSSCIIISAGRLQRRGSIIANQHMSLLSRKREDRCTPIASLVRRNDVYYIESLSSHFTNQPPAPIMAPGVARKPKTSSAQRWHQRLGHTGQKILKKTAQCSKGL